MPLQVREALLVGARTAAEDRATLRVEVGQRLRSALQSGRNGAARPAGALALAAPAATRLRQPHGEHGDQREDAEGDSDALHPVSMPNGPCPVRGSNYPSGCCKMFFIVRSPGSPE